LLKNYNKWFLAKNSVPFLNKKICKAHFKKIQKMPWMVSLALFFRTYNFTFFQGTRYNNVENLRNLWQCEFNHISAILFLVSSFVKVIFSGFTPQKLP